jgi:SAM-dependent methyltransferase
MKNFLKLIMKKPEKTYLSKKHELILNLLQKQYSNSFDGHLFNCLNTDLSILAGIEDTENISKNPYDPRFQELIINNPDKLFLDVGAGFRPVRYENVVNLEIVPYQTTDVLGVAESLPFNSNMFDFVHSNAVLEHVRNPFRAAEEMVRVAKPGATLWISVPFLQPYHGYPNHYYNMTHSGLRNLFEDKLVAVELSVPHYYHPIYALEWFVRQYTWRLSEQDKEIFNNLRIGDIADIVSNPGIHGFISNLPLDSQLELCSGSLLVGIKR